MVNVEATWIVADRLCDCGCAESAHREDGPCRQHPSTCLQWTLPKRLADARAERELHEMYDFGGRLPQLSTSDSHIVLDMLDAVEDGFDQEHGWNDRPRIFVIRKVLGPLGTLEGIAFAELEVPSIAWSLADQNIGVLLEAMAESAKIAPPGSMADLVRLSAATDGVERALIGLGVMGEAWVRKKGVPTTESANVNASVRKDEIRYLHAVDVDERQYYVERSRWTGRRRTTVTTRAEYHRIVAAHAKCDAEAAHVMAMDGSMARIPRALSVLVGRLRDDELLP